jgi:hypothetical protein
MVDALDFRWPSQEEITMKQHWGTHELVEHWTLLPRETKLLTNQTGATRLGFAVLLMFFQLEAYFPQHASAVPTVAVKPVWTRCWKRLPSSNSCAPWDSRRSYLPACRAESYTFIDNVRWLKSPANCADILLHCV